MYKRLRYLYAQWIQLADSLIKATQDRSLVERLDRISEATITNSTDLRDQIASVTDRALSQISEGKLQAISNSAELRDQLVAIADRTLSLMSENSRQSADQLRQLLKEILAQAERLAEPMEAQRRLNRGRPLRAYNHNGAANERIRIAFLFQSASLWPSWESFWRACVDDSRVQPVLVLAPFTYPDRELALFDEARSMLIEKGIGFVTAESFLLENYQPHVVFVQTPYTDSLPPHLQLDAISDFGARLAYIPYGLEIGGGGTNLQYQFNLPAHQTAWRIFARSNRHKKMFAKYCASGSAHVVVTGHPKIDLLANADKRHAEEDLLASAKGRKIVIWSPHFSVQNPPAWSTFTLYGEGILAAIADRPELFLLVRPHPLLFSTLRSNGYWTAGDEEQFRSRLAGMENCELDERDSYLPALSTGDALITDADSFVLEFLATGKPLAYLAHPDGMGLNDDSDVIERVTTATNLAQIMLFLDSVIANSDPGAALRQAAIPEFVGCADGRAGERIRDHIISELRMNDIGTPEMVKPGQAHQDALQYWAQSSHTYLAPATFYDRQEAALRELLEPLALNNALDVGCGDGRFTRLIAEYCSNVKGIDISPALIEKAKAGNKDNIEFAVESIENIRSCGSYDLVTCMGVTSGLMDTSSFIRTLDLLAAMTKSQGILVMKDSLSFGADKILRSDSYVARYRSESAYEKAFARRGLKLESKIELSQMPEKNLVNRLYLFQKA